MSDSSDDDERQTTAEVGLPAEVLFISHPVSEDEDSTDEEYFDTSECLDESASGSLSFKSFDKEPSSSISTEEETGVQSSVTGEKGQAEKCHDVRSCLDKDVQSSSEERKSGESSTDSAYIIGYHASEEGNNDYVNVDVVDAIEEKDVAKLMQRSRVDHYTAGSSEVDWMLGKCKKLFQRDYLCEEIKNYGGSLCKQYPVRIIVPVAEMSRTAGSESLVGVDFDKELYTDQVKASISCRLRKRFVAPVILFDKKSEKTAVYETANKSPPPRTQSVRESPIKRKARHIARTLIDVSSRGREAACQLLTPSSIHNLRLVDAQVMRTLNVQYICDLMIEDRKKYKHIRLSSSEKINPDIYCHCSIEQMPYPGCQFFKRYHKANRVPEGLIFDWNRSEVNTEVKFTEDPNLTFPDIEWDNYKEWDVVDLTKNYMKILLSYLARGNGGLLVHCVSGWDRTPLFVSILRISLWADGIIHESLNYREIAYLSLAYDWYLFGHNLPSRLKRREEIMHFCFKFLPYIASDEFSLTRIFHELPPEQRQNSSLPDFKPGCRSAVNTVSSYVLEIYDEFITGMLG